MKLAFLSLHGMGSQTEKEGDAFIINTLTKLKKKYPKTDFWGKDIYYQHLLEGAEENYWDKASKNYKLKWKSLRKFMIYNFADAASLEHGVQRPKNSSYKAIQKTIAQALLETHRQLGAGVKIIIVAHSLGSQVFSNYLWDAEKSLNYFSNKDDSLSEEEQQVIRLKRPSELITVGSNIALFKAGLKKAQNFDRPHSAFQWINLFDASDPLGFPLRPLDESYDVAWVQDRIIQAGNLLQRWNPASHIHYWKSADLEKQIFQSAEKLLMQ